MHVPPGFLAAVQIEVGGQPIVPAVDPVVGVLGSAVGSVLTTLVVGAIILAVAPDYTRRTAGRVVEEPLDSFLYGLLALLALAVLAVFLVLTIIGILVVVPLVVLGALVWAVGAAIAYLAIADRLVGHDDGWLPPLLLAAAINGGLTLTAVGGIVSFAVGAAGFGAVLRGYLDGRSADA